MRPFFSILLLIILTLVTPVFFLVTSIRYNVLTPRFVKHELVSRNVYALALNQIDVQVAKVVIDPQYPITHTEIAKLAHQIVTEPWLRHSVESIFDHFYAWLLAPPGTLLSLPIEVGYVRNQLTTSADALLAEKLPQLQPCPDPNVPKEEQGLCQFAGMSVSEVKEQLKHAGFDLETIKTLVPDTLDLLRPDLSMIVGVQDADNPEGLAQKSAEIQAKLEKVKAGYQEGTRYFWYAWGAYALLVTAYIALNATRGWRRFTKWTGILLLTISILPLAISVASAPVLAQAVIPYIQFPDTVLAEVQSAAIAAVQDVRGAIFLPILIASIALFVVGLGAIVGARWMPKA